MTDYTVLNVVDVSSDERVNCGVYYRFGLAPDHLIIIRRQDRDVCKVTGNSLQSRFLNPDMYIFESGLAAVALLDVMVNIVVTGERSSWWCGISAEENILPLCMSFRLFEAVECLAVFQFTRLV